MKNSGIWVPENLAQLKKVYRKEIYVYGLPFFHNYFTKPNKDNRINGTNNLNLAFSIIIGTTWNWLMANLAGYEINEYDLGGTITRECYTVTNKSKAISSTHWHDILNISERNGYYRRICSMREELIDIYRKYDKLNDAVDELREYFVQHIAKYIKQDKALTMFTPLITQAEYKSKYGNDAVEKYRADHQGIFCFYVDLTTDVGSWAIRHSNDEIRHNCWLSAKSIQRMLSASGINEKAKHGNRRQATRKQQMALAPRNCSKDADNFEVTQRVL